MLLRVKIPSETLEPAVDHDSAFGAKGLRLLHGVGGQDYAGLFLLSRYSRNHVPHEPTRFRVHSCRRFVQKYHFWVSYSKKHLPSMLIATCSLRLFPPDKLQDITS